MRGNRNREAPIEDEPYEPELLHGAEPRISRYSCGKKAYDKKGAITASNKRYAEDHTRLRIYYCQCASWHLTKQMRGMTRYHGPRKIRTYPSQEDD